MGIFDKNVTGKQMDERASLQYKYNNARTNLLLVVVFTVINIILLIANGTSYFLFSASVPYYVMLFGVILSGRLPADVYEEFIPYGYVFQGLGDGFFAAMLIISLIFVGIYLICWIFSKKNKVGWLIAALVLFSVDTVALLIIGGISADTIIDILFHAWVLFDLGRGIAAYSKLKKLPVTEVTVAENEGAAEVIAEDVPIENTAETVTPAEITENSVENRVDASDDTNFI